MQTATGKTTAVKTPDTMSLRAAAARLGWSHYKTMKAVGAGKIGVINEPGTASKYVRADVERIAQEQEQAAAS